MPCMWRRRERISPSRRRYPQPPRQQRSPRLGSRRPLFAAPASLGRVLGRPSQATRTRTWCLLAHHLASGGLAKKMKFAGCFTCSKFDGSVDKSNSGEMPLPHAFLARSPKHARTSSNHHVECLAQPGCSGGACASNAPLKPTPLARPCQPDSNLNLAERIDAGGTRPSTAFRAFRSSGVWRSTRATAPRASPADASSPTSRRATTASSDATDGGFQTQRIRFGRAADNIG